MECTEKIDIKNSVNFSICQFLHLNKSLYYARIVDKSIHFAKVLLNRKRQCCRFFFIRDVQSKTPEFFLICLCQFPGYAEAVRIYINTCHISAPREYFQT